MGGDCSVQRLLSLWVGPSHSYTNELVIDWGTSELASHVPWARSTAVRPRGRGAGSRSSRPPLKGVGQRAHPSSEKEGGHRH